MTFYAVMVLQCRLVPAEFHRWLIGAMAARHAGDYGGSGSISPEESAEQVARAERFLALAEERLGPAPEVP